MNQYKKYKKKAGKCPICGQDLAKSKQELFDTLGLDIASVIENGLSLQEVKKAYKEKAKEVHPDHGGSAQEFQDLSNAKEELVELIEEELDPLGLRKIEESSKPVQPTTKDIHVAMEAIKNIRKCYNSNQPCPYCKRKPKRD